MKFKFYSSNLFRWVLVVLFFIVLIFFLINKDDNSELKLKVISRIDNNFEIKHIQYIKIAGKILKVDLALTGEEQEQGLSGRNKLEENEGMLFVFDHIDRYAFWMKNMNFSIDIIWINDDFEVVYVKNDASPKSYPEIFKPTEKVRYVLEVNSIFSENNNLKVGDKVEFLSP